jgi:macrolide transport system ATP-binding/permease protein
MTVLLQDLPYALRQGTSHPGFALTSILILALGMGVSGALFGFVDAALLQPLPYERPERLMSGTKATSNLHVGHFRIQIILTGNG